MCHITLCYYALGTCSSLCVYFSRPYRSYSLAGLHDTDNIFKVMGSKVKITDAIFRNALFWWRHTDHHLYCDSDNNSHVFLLWYYRKQSSQRFGNCHQLFF